MTKWLVALLVGFVAFAPSAPVFVYAEDDEGFSEETIQLVTEDQEGFLEALNEDPIGLGQSIFGDDFFGDDDEAEADPDDNGAPGPDPATLGPNPDDDDDDANPSDPSTLGPDSSTGSEQAGPDENGLPTDPDSLGPTNPELLGPGFPGLVDITFGNDDEAGITGEDGESIDPDRYGRPEVDLSRLDDYLAGLPRDADSAREYWEEHFDEQSVATGDESSTGQTESATATTTPTTEVSNNIDGDDGVVSQTATTTQTADINTDNELEQNNVTTGTAVSGDQLIHSDKDVLEATIQTGTAEVTSDAEVKGNSTNVQTIYGGGDEWIQKSFGSEVSNSNSGDDNIVSGIAEEFRQLTVVNKNKAFISNIKDLVARSGANRISGLGRVKDGGIATGASRVKSSLLNLINTNCVDCAFLPVTFDIFDNFTGNINILELLFDAFGLNLDGPGAITSTATNENSESDDSILDAQARTERHVDVTNENLGFIHNDLDIVGVSGQNQILAGRKAKDLQITTDDVAITNNLVNFLNTNLFASKMGVVVVNVFADNWLGNLILPSASRFAGSVQDPTGVSTEANLELEKTDDTINNALAIATSDLEFVSEQQAGVETQINIDANTGDNYGFFDKDGEDIEIESGETNTQSNLLTLANRDIIGTAFSHGFFNIRGGNWIGSVVGAPESARVEGSQSGFVIADEALALNSGQPALSAKADISATDVDDAVHNVVAEVKSRVKVNNLNEGYVVNKLNIVADTGTNDVASYKGERVKIDTGDVNVANNVSTFLNTNCSFCKGLTVALNVFGDWQGNVAYDEFADLAAAVDLLSDPASLAPGSQLSYEVSVRNSGTEPTEPGTLSFGFDPNKFELIDSAGASVSGQTLSWPYGAFESADSATHEVVLRLWPNLGTGQHSLTATANIDATDFNDQNNSASTSFALNVADPNAVAGDDQGGAVDNETGESGQSDNENGTVNAAASDGDDQGNGSDGSSGANEEDGSDVIQGGSGSGGGGYRPARLAVDKTVQSGGPFKPGDEVSYQITIQNTGTADAQAVVVYDSFAVGSDSSDASWPLQIVKGGEEVIIDYTITMLAELASGVYTNTAYASGFDAANQVVRSDNAVATITIDNPTIPAVTDSSGVSDSGGVIQGGDEFEVLDSFNRGATSTSDITRDDSTPTGTNSVQIDTTNGAQVGSGFGAGQVLSQAEVEALESELEQQIEGSASISRRLVPVAQAADAIGGSTSSIQGASSTRLAVYPQFLHFDGLQRSPSEQVSEAGSGGSWLTSWVFWLLLILILAAAYVSYREKQQRKFHRW